MIPALSPVGTASSRAGDLAALWRDYDDLWNARNVAAEALSAAESPPLQLRNNAIDAPTRSVPLWLVGTAGARSSPKRRSDNRTSVQQCPNQHEQAEVPRWDRMLPEAFAAIEAIPGNHPMERPIAADRVYQRQAGDAPSADARARKITGQTPVPPTSNPVLRSVSRLAERQRAQARRCFVGVSEVRTPRALPLAAAA